jgi:hypothetical protein
MVFCCVYTDVSNILGKMAIEVGRGLGGGMRGDVVTGSIQQ